jgi:hypothetical protein
MKTSESIALISVALAACQGELSDAAKSSSNPAFKNQATGKASKYADLAEVLQTIRPVAAKHGISYVQAVEDGPREGTVAVSTRLMHKGEWLEGTIVLPLGQKTAQGTGGCATYGRRYGLAAMFGISQEDDDGNAASGVGGGSAGGGSRASKAAEPSTGMGAIGEAAGPAVVTESKATPTPKGNKKTEASAEDIAGLKAAFDAANTREDVTKLVGQFTRLTPAQQTEVLPNAKLARERAGL